MPLMTRIRERLATFFSIFAGLFVIYIVLDWGMDLPSQKQASRAAEAQEIGRINGDPILYRDFAELVRQNAENQRNQTGQEPDDEQLKLIRDQVWNSLIDQRLFDEAADRFDIKVTDQEIVDWVRGDDPPDFLRQQFTDSLGTFDRLRYESVIMDPRNKKIMVSVESFLRNQRLREKIQSAVLSSVRVSEGDVFQRYTDANIRYEVDYVLFDLNVLVKDDEISIAEPDLHRHYKDHADEFKAEATRRLKYVLFREHPSRSDTDYVLSELEDIARQAREGADFLELVEAHSQRDASDAYFKRGDLSPAVETAVFNAPVGAVIGPIAETDGYHLIKVLDFRKGSEELVRASHILTHIQGDDSAQALSKAREIYNRARNGEDFETLARQHSQDQGSAARGGDLGWFGKGRMVKPFEEAAFKARVGQVVGPVRSTFGYHVIKVVGRDNREVKFADVHQSVRVSALTRNEMYQKAQDFAYLAKEGDFTNEAELSKYTVSETPPFQREGVVPGIGVNPAISRFAFSNKVGAISEPFSTGNGVVVVMVSEVKDAGVRPFDEVKSTIESRVMREKKMERVRAIATELRNSLSPGEELQKLAGQRPDLSVQRAGPFNLTGFVPVLGRDLGFIGGVSSLELGELSPLIEGQRGIFIAKLASKTPFDSSAYDAQRDQLRNQILSERRSRFFSEWYDQLKKSANIVDNRDLFYR